MSNAQRHWLRVSSWLVAAMGCFQLLNTFRAVADPAGFAAYMGLPLSDPANDGFVLVYALRAAFVGLLALVLLVRRDIRTLAFFALVALVMPLGDAILTAVNGADPMIVARHAAIAVAVAITAALLFMRAREQDNN